MFLPERCPKKTLNFLIWNHWLFPIDDVSVIYKGVYECIADNGVDNVHKQPVIDQVYLIVDCKWTLLRN